MKRKTPFAHHALERVCERYGVRLTGKQQQAFGRTLSNPKHTIPLTRNRLACYFEGRWYLLVCTSPINAVPLRTMPSCTVQTFLRLEDASDDDKRILRHDERYRRINNDAFHVLSVSPSKTTGRLFLMKKLQVKKTVELPGLTEDELPHDEIRSAESMLNTYCDEKHYGECCPK